MYNKLFSKILDSSIWLEPDPTRIVWVTLLAAMDEDGFCPFACAANIANRARVSLEAAETALKTLESPDPNSGDPEHEGRRIERVPGGWLVLNGPKYREVAARETMRASTRKRVQAFRDRKRNAAVTPSNASLRNQKHIQIQETSSSEQRICSDFGATQEKQPGQSSEEGIRLAALLRSEILQNKSDYRITPQQEKKWAQTADRMLRRDKRTEAQISTLIRWVQHDEFWRSNVLSMDKLRDKFDALEMKRLASSKSNGSAGNYTGPIAPSILSDNPATRAKAMLEGD